MGDAFRSLLDIFIRLCLRHSCRCHHSFLLPHLPATMYDIGQRGIMLDNFSSRQALCLQPLMVSASD